MKITKQLLLHWWHYYGKDIYTLAELDKFSEAIDSYGAKKIFEVASLLYYAGDGSPTRLLYAIRNNNLDSFIDSLPKIDEMAENEQRIYELLKQQFYTIIDSSYRQ